MRLLADEDVRAPLMGVKGSTSQAQALPCYLEA